MALRCGEDGFPVGFHVDDGPAFGGGFVEGFVEFADAGGTVVGVFAFGVGVVDEEGEARAEGGVAGGGVLEHLEVAVGVAEGHDGAFSDDAVDGLGFAGAVVDEFDFGFLDEEGGVAAHLEGRDAAAADDLFGRDAVGLLGKAAHEFDTAAGDDEGFEAVRAEVGEEFEHRLVDALDVGAVEPSGAAAVMSQSETMALNSSVVMPEWVTATISSMPFSPAAARPFISPARTDLKGSFSCQSGCCGAMALMRSRAKRNWKYIGCSHQRVPSLSKVAMRSSGLTKSGEPSFVTRSTKSVTDFLVGPSFQEGSGSSAAFAAAENTSSRITLIHAASRFMVVPLLEKEYSGLRCRR